MRMDQKITATLALSALALACAGQPACAGPNDFFGTSVPDGTSPTTGAGRPITQAPANPYADPQVPQGDFTSDEKRMQKKYKASIQNAKSLIAKGDKMMEAGQRGHKDKEFKKGKILKEIGERQLSELSANNPLADILEDKTGDKKKTADAQTTTTQ